MQEKGPERLLYTKIASNDAIRRPTYQLKILKYDDAHLCSAVIRVSFRTYCRFTESALTMTHLRERHRS
jgi:hypothetical protein